MSGAAIRSPTLQQTLGLVLLVSRTATLRNRGVAVPLLGRFPRQHLVEQVDGDAAGEFGHGQVGEFCGRSVNIERGPDLVTGSFQQGAAGEVPSRELFQQPLCHDDGRVGILPGEQVAVLHHVWVPDRAATELDADPFLQLVLEQPLAPGG